MSQRNARLIRQADPATNHIRRTKAALRDARIEETRQRHAELEVERKLVLHEQRENRWFRGLGSVAGRLNFLRVAK